MLRDLLIIDCIFYQLSSTGVAKLWNEVFRVWDRLYPGKIALLDRGGEIKNYGIKKIPFPKFDLNNPEAHLKYLANFLEANKVKNFLSTYYTFGNHESQRKAIVYDMIPEVLKFERSPEIVLKNEYLKNSSRAFCISKSTADDLLDFFPHLENEASYCLPGISHFFQPITEEMKQRVRAQLNVTKKNLIVLPCYLESYKDGISALKAILRSKYIDEIEVICTFTPPRPDEITDLFREFKLRFMRFERDEDYALLVASSNIVMWPSHIEGVGFPPLEAIVCGVQPVICNSKVNLEIYGHDIPFAEVGNPESIASVLDYQINQPISLNIQKKVDLIKNYDLFAQKIYQYGVNCE